MADVLFRGMEMPKGCGVCPFKDDECFGAWKCWRVKDWGDDDNRAKGCPLVPLPEGHGKLGDLDKLKKLTYEIKTNRGTYERVINIVDLLNAPTIVPAEGGNADGV